jgi:hypothetical protein
MLTHYRGTVNSEGSRSVRLAEGQNGAPETKSKSQGQKQENSDWRPLWNLFEDIVVKSIYSRSNIVETVILQSSN